MCALRTPHILVSHGGCRSSTSPSSPHSLRKLSRLSFTLRAPVLAHCLTKISNDKRGLESLGSTMTDSDSRRTAEVDCDGYNKLVPVNADYTEIVVVRHGETEWNADGRIQGHLDVELNEVGRQQATAVADRLSKEGKISVIYSSDLKRAFETAELIATACGGLEVNRDPDLRERNLGELQGIQLSEAASIRPLAYKAFLSHQTDKEIPGGGESIDQLYQRCTTCLQNISTKHKGERVVVVTHGGVIRSLHRRACPSKRGGKVLNTSVNIFHLFDGDKWILRSWGDVSHLNQTKYLSTGFGGDRTSG